MTYFPQQSNLRPASKPSGARPATKPGLVRDILWGRPVFKAPALANPRVAFDPLPFTVNRTTRRPE